MAYCGKCGTEISEGAKFCPKCGNPTSEPNKEVKGKNKAKKLGWLIPLLSALFIVFVVLFMYINLSKDSPLEKITDEVTNYFGTNKDSSTSDDKNEKETIIQTENNNSKSTSNQESVDISPILYECQEEITSIQREIEDACRTFAVLASDNNIDVMKYGQMKITFTNGVDDLVRDANKAFDRCADRLKQAGVKDAASKVNEEKRQFNSAIYSLKMKTLQQTEVGY